MKRLKKYFIFAKSGMSTTLAYKGEIFLWFIGGIIIAIVSALLWKAIYSFSPENTINGFTLSQMILYVMVIVVINEVTYCPTFSRIADDIKQGQIGMRLIKPISYRMQLCFNTIGSFIIRMIIVGVPFLLIFTTFCCFVLGSPIPIWYNILIFILFMFLSILIVDAFQFIFGLCGFLTQEMFGLNMILQAIIGFMSGSAIPLSFFPKTLQDILYFTPFPSMMSYPALIFMGKLSGIDIIKAFLMGLIWLVALKLIGALLFKRAVKHVVVFGG